MTKTRDKDKGSVCDTRAPRLQNQNQVNCLVSQMPQTSKWPNKSDAYKGED